MKQITDLYIFDYDSNFINRINNPSILEFCKKYQDDSRNSESLFYFNKLREIVLNKREIDINNLDFYINSYGKPYFKEFFFNISHSLSIVLIGLSNEEIGVDIEYIDHFKEKRINSLFSDNETKLIEKEIDLTKKINLISEFWVRKEAFIKFKGVGITKEFLKEEIDVKVFSFLYDKINLSLCIFPQKENKLIFNNFAIDNRIKLI